MAKRTRRHSSTSTTASSGSDEATSSLHAPGKKARPSAKVSDHDAAGSSSRISDKIEGQDAELAGHPVQPDEHVPSIKIFNMNVNGAMKSFARKNKRLETLLKEQDPDIVVLTEMHYDPQAPLKRKEDGMASYQRFKSRYPHFHIGINAGAAGRAGIAVYSKTEPISIIKSGLPTFDDPTSTKGRFIQFEYAEFYLVAVYSFHSGNSDKREAHEIRKKWDLALRKHLHELDKVKPVICTGDQNVAPTNDDVYKATGKLSRKPIIGCILPHEREAWFDLLEPRSGSGENALIDAWRAKHPEEKKVFTHTGNDGTLNFFSGFRLDHFIVSERLMPRITNCEILNEETAMSDHIPIIMELRVSV